MGRPKMKEAKLKVSLNVTVAPRVNDLAEKTENKSRFIEKSVLSMAALQQLVHDLRSRSLSLEACMEEIEDLVDIWESEFDESVDYKPLEISK